MSLKIFISHSTKYSDLAVKLKLSLLALESEKHLDIRISEDMAGAQDWLGWIEKSVRSADVFLLLYPHPEMDMGWCNYELGRFLNRKRPVLCIKNVGISKPPPAFHPYQAYTANTTELFKFLKELFVTGEFTRKVALNSDIDNPSSEFYSRAQEVCKVLASQFDQARVQEHLYERRIIISLKYDKGGLNRDKSTIEGNNDGLSLLGLSPSSVTPWSALAATLGTNGEWLSELESALPMVITGALPPVLSPLRTSSGIYLPIVIKAESADDVPIQVIVIFVSAGVERLQPMLGWPFPKGMPALLAYHIKLLRSMFKARWEILEPRVQEVQFKSAPVDRRMTLAKSVVADYEQMEKDFERDVSTGMDAFFSAYDTDLVPEVRACSAEWLSLISQLRDDFQPDRLPEVFSGLLKNNGRWLLVTTKQFSRLISKVTGDAAGDSVPTEPRSEPSPLAMIVGGVTS